MVGDIGSEAANTTWLSAGRHGPEAGPLPPRPTASPGCIHCGPLTGEGACASLSSFEHACGRHTRTLQKQRPTDSEPLLRVSGAHVGLCGPVRYPVLCRSPLMNISFCLCRERRRKGSLLFSLKKNHVKGSPLEGPLLPSCARRPSRPQSSRVLISCL